MNSTLLASFARGGSLAVVGLTAALLLSMAQSYAAPEIELRQKEDMERLLAEVVSANNSASPRYVYTRNEVAVTSGQRTTYQARDASGKLHAVAFEVVGNGYGGPIRILMAVDPVGTLQGVRVLQHTETPGLGDKIERSKSIWVESFRGKSIGNPPRVRWAVKPDGGDFDAFTGATITPRAVVRAVREGLEEFGGHQARYLSVGAVPSTERR